MPEEVFQGILIPFLGTTLGAVCVLFMKNGLSAMVQRALAGFAAGVMVAASVWSLLIPSIEQSAFMGRWAFVTAAVGFWAGILFLLFLDHTVIRLHRKIRGKKNPDGGIQKATMMVLAVTLHNIPEGMSVGVAFAGWMAGNESVLMAGAFALSIGIAIQNVPEGAIISMPLRAEGMKKWKAFLMGTLSGAVEPLAALFTVWAAGFVVPALPYMLSFAAGAMIYVVVEELVPEMSRGKESDVGIVFFTLGFTVMLALDVALG